MPRLPLTLAGWNHFRTLPLEMGTLQPEGLDLTYLVLPVEEVFWRMARYEEFDASEMSLSAYCIMRAQGDDRFIAIPVFPSRVFRHGYIFVHADSRITRPEELAGRRVGVPEYAQTAVVWMRGTLQHDHGVRPEQVCWLVGGQEEPGRRDRVDHPLPPGLSIEPIPPGKTLTGMLEAGELDAVISARMPTAFQRGSPRVRRLFQDWKTVEVEYYRRTRLFPIMHVVVLRRALYERHPWAAMSLYKAYCQAKAQVERRVLTTAYRHILPWILAELEEVRTLFPNGDCFPYGLEANRHALETFLQYEQEQGLLQKPLTPEDLFAPNTLEEFRI